MLNTFLMPHDKCVLILITDCMLIWVGDMRSRFSFACLIICKIFFGILILHIEFFPVQKKKSAANKFLLQRQWELRVDSRVGFSIFIDLRRRQMNPHWNVEFYSFDLIELRSN